MRPRPWLQAEHSLVGGPSEKQQRNPAEMHPREKMEGGATWGSVRKATLTEPSKGQCFLSRTPRTLVSSIALPRTVPGKQKVPKKRYF